MKKRLRKKKRTEEFQEFGFECGSDKIASILYGLPALSEDLQSDLDEGRVVLVAFRVMTRAGSVLSVGRFFVKRPQHATIVSRSDIHQPDKPRKRQTLNFWPP
ncbi:hypothetical protein KAI46_06440 [bacterium]|nr:hypothetical protein [bacterium]